MGMLSRRRAAMLAAFCLSAIVSSSIACGDEEPEGLRDRFLTHIRADLDRLPDFVCVETSERFRRAGSQQSWEKIDTVRFDVGIVGDREMYSLPGARRFERRPLGDLIAQGSISTGELALIARHVFSGSAAQLAYKGESEQTGRKAYEYSYDVSAGNSNYHLRLGRSDAVVAFQGTFWIDAATLDLLRLEVQAYDIPESLGLAQADTALEYSRVKIDATDVLLPSSVQLIVTATNGDENMNRARFNGCRHYQTESTIRFAAGESPESGTADRAIPTSPELPKIPNGTLLALSLDEAIDPASSRIGDPIKATLTRDVKIGDRILLLQGATASGRVVRIEKSTMPYPIYQIGLQFDSIVVGDRVLPIVLTMDQAGPASGLLRQSKRLDPVFTRKRTNRIDVLVREVQRGEGILDWDAKHTPVPRGLRMVWRVEQ